MNVHFLIRNDFETVKDKGLNIQSIDGNYSIHPNIYRNPQEIGNCDLVLIALKSTANDNFSNLLTPLVGKQTALFTCLLYTSPSPRDYAASRMPSSA